MSFIFHNLLQYGSKVLGQQYFGMFLEEVSYALRLIKQCKNTVVLKYCNLKLWFSILIYFKICDPEP